ncbi:MAG: hypothetical protein GY816_14485 [Cytophagales bacterium]|nr:hypothetical protein [Cytophagales bacterium]
MIKTFTKNDLLRFLYDELPNQDRDDVMSMQITDESVEHETHEMESVVKLLDGFRMRAPQDAVDTILDYSKKA